jgi:hypothetical protein
MVKDQVKYFKDPSQSTFFWFGIPLFGVITMGFFAWRLWLNNPSVPEENSFIENFQLVFLFSAIFAHGLRMFQESIQELRIYHAALALLCFSVALREFEIDDIGSSTIWPAVEISIRSIAVSAWIWLIYRLTRNFRKLWAIRHAITRSMKSVQVYLAITFYLGSWFFDKNHVPIDAQLSKFIEQSLQLGGTVFFLTSALIPPFGRLNQTAR